MPQDVDREAVQRLVDDNRAQLVEVLPTDEYENWHLPGAIHLPLRRVEKDARKKIDSDRPIIVYCWDTA